MISLRHITFLAAGIALAGTASAAFAQASSAIVGNEPSAASLDLSPDAQAMMQRYYDGAYPEVAREGPALLEKEPGNYELRFAVANSLAWTGFHREALAQYEMLEGTPFNDQARLGWGHVQRWQGRHDRAAIAFRDVMAKEPGNADAVESLRLAEREIRPRTTVRVGHADNSDNASRTWTTVSHEWRNASGAVIYGITAGHADEEKNGVSVTQRDLAFRIEAMDAPLSPRFEISAQESPTSEIFANLTLKPEALPVRLTMGRINWGKSAFDVQALKDGLTADQLGISTNLKAAWGTIRGAYDHYRISDDNVIETANLNFTPALQPFGTRHFKLFAGLEAREARRYDARYWTPVEGHYSAFAGLLGEWSSPTWESYAYLQYGVPVKGPSGDSWSAGFSVQHWLNERWVAGFDFWAMHTPRDGGYRSNSSLLRVGRVW